MVSKYLLLHLLLSVAADPYRLVWGDDLVDRIILHLHLLLPVPGHADYSDQNRHRLVEATVTLRPKDNVPRHSWRIDCYSELVEE